MVLIFDGLGVTEICGSVGGHTPISHNNKLVNQFKTILRLRLIGVDPLFVTAFHVPLSVCAVSSLCFAALVPCSFLSESTAPFGHMLPSR